LGEAVGVGTGLDDVAAEGDAVDDGRVEPGTGRNVPTAVVVVVVFRLISRFGLMLFGAGVSLWLVSPR
jgi:hypothetical protein